MSVCISHKLTFTSPWNFQTFCSRLDKRTCFVLYRSLIQVPVHWSSPLKGFRFFSQTLQEIAETVAKIMPRATQSSHTSQFIVYYIMHLLAVDILLVSLLYIIFRFRCFADRTSQYNVLLTVHLNIILATGQLNAQVLVLLINSL